MRQRGDRLNPELRDGVVAAVPCMWVLEGSRLHSQLRRVGVIDSCCMLRCFSPRLGVLILVLMIILTLLMPNLDGCDVAGMTIMGLAGCSRVTSGCCKPIDVTLFR